MPLFLRGRGGQTLAAFVAYVALTIAMTWPIARGITRDVPADLGDALLNMWIMAWDSEALVAMASGTMSFADLWNGNIFHPSPLSLTFSEHLLPQAVQGLPFYLATGNIVLAYNVVFLATFALSGLGMFLFVRELTGQARVAFVAGLFFAFVPYRLGQFPHVQTISSQWMPFALFGLRRYFDTGRLTALAGGVAAFVVQGLSTGYYLFYFAPVLGGYALWEITVRRRLRHGPTWIAMGAAAVGAVGASLPFLLPYLEARDTFGLTRPFEEVLGLSADLYAYLNAPPQLYFWGPRLNGHPQPEGDLFFGAVQVVLALVAVGLWSWQAWRAGRGQALAVGTSDGRVRLLLGLTAATLVAALVLAVTGGYTGEVAGVTVRITNVRRAMYVAALLFALVLWYSPRVRTAVRAHPGDLTPLFVIAVVFAVVMSLGPVPRAGGVRLSGLGLYAAFFEWVPGYDGLRVPARFAMVAAVMLAPLAAYALAPLGRRGLVGTLALGLTGTLFLAESYAVPMPLNLNWDTGPRYAMPWGAVHRLNDGPLAYRHLLAMPDDTVVMELPFGDSAWDLRYVYYAGLHGKRIVNGYSGYFPEGYRARAARLSAIWTDRDAAWTAITTSGATHVLVHVDGFREQEGPAMVSWLQSQGARIAVGFDDGDLLFALPR